MAVTSPELKTNLAEYLLLAATQDIFITENGKIIAKLTSPYQERVNTVNSLIGVIPLSYSIEEIKDERVSEI